MRIRLKNKDQGFTLIEIAIVMVVVGLVFAALATTFKTYMVKKREAELIEKTNAVTSALAVYIQDESHYGDNPATTGTIETDFFVADPNGAQFPCPADPTLGPGDASYGQEARSGGSCTASGGISASGTGTNTIYHGSVPFVTLGLSSEYELDQYGYKLTYAVSQAVSNDNALSNGKKPAGAITVRKYDDTGTFTTVPNVPFVLVAHGPTGYGAYSAEGNLIGTCQSSKRDGENCDYNNEIYTDAMDYRSDNNASNTFYDDTLIMSLRGIADKEDYWGHAANTQDIHSLNPGDVGLFIDNPLARMHVLGASGSEISTTNPVDEYTTSKNYSIISEGADTDSGGILITTGDVDDDQEALSIWNSDVDSVIFEVSARSGNTAIGGNLAVADEVTADAYYYSSDKRLKENFRDLKDGTLDDLMMLHVLKYNMIDNPDELKIGVIAQDLQQYFPELVATSENGMLKVDYPGLTGPLIKGIQELKTDYENDIDELKSEIKALKAEIEEIKKYQKKE